MNSHQYAAQLREIATVLEQAPSFEVEPGRSAHIDIMWFHDKASFLKAVQAIRVGVKDWSDKNYFNFRRKFPSGAELTLSISRNLVCVKVQEEKWECLPLLSREEVEQASPPEPAERQPISSQEYGMSRVADR